MTNMCRNISVSTISIAVIWLASAGQVAKSQDATQESKSTSLGITSSVEKVQLSDVFIGWQQIASKYANSIVTWAQSAPTAIISRLNAESTTSPPAAYASQRLHIKGDDFFLESARIAVSDTQRFQDVVVSAPVSTYMPERGADPFFGQLYSYFQQPQSIVTWQPFARKFSGGQLLDYWDAAGKQSARAHRMPLSDYGTSRWGTLRFEIDDNEHCTSLDLWGLVIALRPSSSLFNIRPENCKLDLDLVPIDDRNCYRLSERGSSGTGHRLWFVEAAPPFVVCRYIGNGDKDGVQVDMQWANEKGERRLVGWRYIVFPNGEAPTVYFGHSLITSLDNVTSALPNRVDMDDLPVGTWVVDDVRGEQFIINEANQKRIIESTELSWLPLPEELQATNSGKVSTLIERKIFWRKLMRGEVNLPVILSILFLTSIAVFCIGRRVIGGPMRGK